MKKPQITITIDGAAGSGKTTLAQYLAAHLGRLHGVKCSISDDGQVRQVRPPACVYADLPEYFDAEVAFVVVQK